MVPLTWTKVGFEPSTNCRWWDSYPVNQPVCRLDLTIHPLPWVGFQSLHTAPNHRLKSVLLVPQRYQRIDLRRSSRRHVTRKQRHRYQEQGDRPERNWIGGAHLEKQTAH